MSVIASKDRAEVKPNKPEEAKETPKKAAKAPKKGE